LIIPLSSGDGNIDIFRVKCGTLLEVAINILQDVVVGATSLHHYQYLPEGELI
jgi:hypothetical protein